MPMTIEEIHFTPKEKRFDALEEVKIFKLTKQNTKYNLVQDYYNCSSNEIR
jgi:hypothetical protein